MIDYVLIKHIHILLAFSSGLGFALRGFVRIVLERSPRGAAWRILPHALDTLLLASGVWLWALTGWPLVSWLGLKLILLLAYILLGMAAFRARRQHHAALIYLTALALFVGIAAIAVGKPV